MAEHERVEAPAALMGIPDGPHLYVPELGLEVPTYINPRKDLIPKKAWAFKRISHHIPFNMRGVYKPQWLPPRHYAMYGHQYRIDLQGYAMCAGRRIWTDDNRKSDNPTVPCSHRAVNRTPFCPNHGGALHPADKALSSKNLSISKVEPERIEKLDRVQKFMSGLLNVADLDDDEVIGSFVRNDQGRAIVTQKMGVRFQQQIVKELMHRVSRFMQMKLPNMVKVLTDIAESDFAEPADRIKAADIVINRTMGKVPDVVFHGTTDKPYEAILHRIEGGSREAYRNRAIAAKENEKPLDVIVVDDETELEPEVSDDGNNGSNGAEIPQSGNASGHGDRVSESSGIDYDDVGSAKVAKEAKDKLKKAKNRRFAARAQGIVNGDPAFLLEYIGPYSYGYKVKIYPPEQQTQAVLDRIRDAELRQIGV